MASEIGISAQVQVDGCAECKQPSVCTCSICNAKMCLKHINSHMDKIHMLSENDSHNTKCSLHVRNTLKSFCRSCFVPLCDECVTDGGHVAHERSELEAVLEFLKGAISNENTELINCIKPFYQKILDTTEEKLKKVPLIYEKVKKNVEKFGKILHREIDNAVDHMYISLTEKEKNDEKELENQKNTYLKRLNELNETIAQNKSLLSSRNSKEIANFSSSIEYFRLNPSQVKLELPSFTPNTNNQQIKEKCLALLGEILYTPETSVVPDLKSDHAKQMKMQLLKQPGVLKILENELPSDFRDHRLYSLSCLNSETVLLGGNSNVLFERTLYYNDLQQFQPVHITYTGFYFALSSTGALFYSDRKDKSVKRMKNRTSNKISTFLKLESWEPKGLTMTRYDHLLLCLFKRKQSKVVQYAQTGHIVQEIQYSKGKLLYEHPMFICCNGNGDICTADHEKQAIIVVDQFGVFKFSYNGHNPLKSSKKFTPSNIATDHLCNIAITDLENHQIHLLDKYGEFLRFIIPDAGVKYPRAIAIDKDGKMWLGEGKSGCVKVLQYLK